MAGFSLKSLQGITAKQLRELVKATSDQDMAAALAGPDREAILDGVFERFPRMFNGVKAVGAHHRINFRVTGGPDGGSDTYAVVIKDGSCTIEKSPVEQPNVSLMMGPADFFKILTNTGNPMMMAMTGRLKVRGDLGLAQSFSKYFDIPKS